MTCCLTIDNFYVIDFLFKCVSKFEGPSRARHSSSKDMPDSAGSHKLEPVTPVMAGKERPISMHELGSASADRLRGLSSYETTSVRPTSERQSAKASRQLETINPPGETVNKRRGKNRISCCPV